MKAVVAVILLIMLTINTVDVPAQTQTAPADARPQSSQWLSHQMNQPPPDPGTKTILSEEIIEEIRQLYLQAKKELEQKAASPNK